MKILIYIEQFCNHTETFIYDHVNLLSKDHQILVVCHKRINEEKFPFDNIKVVPLTNNEIRNIKTRTLQKLNLSLNLHNKRIKNTFNDLISTFKPNLIHCHFGIQALRLIQNYNLDTIPILITFHGYDASMWLRQSKIYRRTLSTELKKAHIFCHFVSKALQQNFSEYKIIPRWDVVYYLGVDTQFFRRAQQTKSQVITFLQVSSLTEKKGHAESIKSFAKLVRQSEDLTLQYLIAGEGQLLPKLRKLASSLNINSNIRFVGLVDRIETRRLMQQANYYIHNSITPFNGNTEGIPVSIMEAMSMELPILATRHSGIPELVEHGVNGLLADEKDVAEYFTNMKEILNWTYSKQNRQKIESCFSHVTFKSNIELVYKEIIKRYK